MADGVTDTGQKKVVLLYITGSAVSEIYSTLDEKESDDYNEVKKKLTDQFAPLKNLDYEIFAFSQIRQFFSIGYIILITLLKLF